MLHRNAGAKVLFFFRTTKILPAFFLMSAQSSWWWHSIQVKSTLWAFFYPTLAFFYTSGCFFILTFTPFLRNDENRERVRWGD